MPPENTRPSATATPAAAADAIAGVQDPSSGTARPRSSPYTWYIWLAKVLSQQSTCTYAHWFKTHHTWTRMPSDFDAADWQRRHRALQEDEIKRLHGLGCAYRIGNQNQWRLQNQHGCVLAGTPDLSAVFPDHDTPLLVNCHPGQPKTTDIIAMQICMYAWRYAKMPDHPTPQGRLVYTTGVTEVPADSINPPFVQSLRDTMALLTADQPAPKAPSWPECRFCDITPQDCPERVMTDDQLVQIT